MSGEAGAQADLVEDEAGKEEVSRHLSVKVQGYYTHLDFYPPGNKEQLNMNLCSRLLEQLTQKGD